MQIVDVQLPGQEKPIRMVRLTPREKSLIRLVAEGKSNKQIAFRLQLAEGTIKVYLSHIYSRLNLDDRYGCMKWALQHPEALLEDREAVSPADLHPEGCGCEAVYCSAMRAAIKPREELAA